MTTIYYDSSLHLQGSFAATIGFFDGLHRGHRYLLEQLQQVADERRQQTMVITFDQHPRQTLQSEWQPMLLSTFAEKQALLATTGIDVLLVLRFNRAMAALSAHDFMRSVLSEQLSVKTLLTGYDNRFGHDRVQGFDDYAAFGRELNIEVLLAKPLPPFNAQYSTPQRPNSPTPNTAPVSSSLVRRLLQAGDVAEAAHCLGRPYTLTGQVVHGQQIGRRLGFPTANLRLTDPCKLIPKVGVYAVKATTALPSHVGGDLQSAGGDLQSLGGDLQSPSLPPKLALMNIGTRPTFDGHEQTLEVHLLDFSGDLYGQQLTVSFMARIRDEQHFDSPEALARQMALDRDTVRRL